jgi:hypothetical protein
MEWEQSIAYMVILQMVQERQEMSLFLYAEPQEMSLFLYAEPHDAVK